MRAKADWSPFIANGANWRQIFLGSAAALAGLALVVRVTLKASPTVVGLPLQTINPGNVYGAAGAEAAPAISDLSDL